MSNKIEDIKTQHHFKSGVYAREMELPKGWAAETHSHKFSHMSILAQGVAIVTVDGKETRYEAPSVINIEALKKHSIFAEENVVWFCVHPSECEDLESLEKILIEER